MGDIERLPQTPSARGMSQPVEVGDPVVRQLIEEMQGAINDLANRDMEEGEEFSVTSPLSSGEVMAAFVEKRKNAKEEVLVFYARAITHQYGKRMEISSIYPIAEIPLPTGDITTQITATPTVTGVTVKVGWSES